MHAGRLLILFLIKKCWSSTFNSFTQAWTSSTTELNLKLLEVFFSPPNTVHVGRPSTLRNPIAVLVQPSHSETAHAGTSFVWGLHRQWDAVSDGTALQRTSVSAVVWKQECRVSSVLPEGGLWGAISLGGERKREAGSSRGHLSPRWWHWAGLS